MTAAACVSVCGRRRVSLGSWGEGAGQTGEGGRGVRV